MLNITITQTDDMDKDLEALDSIVTTLECFPGNKEVRLKIVDQWYEITLLRLNMKVDSDNMDMVELLLAIDNVEVGL